MDDRTVAEYVARDKERLVGFLSVDPTVDGWEREMRDGREVYPLVCSSGCESACALGYP